MGINNDDSLLELTDKTILQLRKEILKIKNSSDRKKGTQNISRSKNIKGDGYKTNITIEFRVRTLKGKTKDENEEENEE